MPSDPLDLWPDDIRLDPLSPLKILRHQAERLSERTRGLLTAEVLTTTEPTDSEYLAPSGKETVHRFEITVPKLKGYRYQMFECRHDSEQIYPVYIEADDNHEIDTDDETAATQDELMLILRKLFASKQHRGVITSLLTRIAEADTKQVPA
jgi:hypothetical protein